MKALLMPNLLKEKAAECGNNIAKTLRKFEIVPLADERFKDVLVDGEVEFGEFYSMLEKADLVIAVGGDGTLIHSAKHAAESNKPLLGVNAGRFGFLSGLEASELELLKKLKTKDYVEEKRMMLEVTYYGMNQTKTYYALNDAAVSHSEVSRMIDLNIVCNDSKIMTCRADGGVFSTPTGSTAYSLSAGGPIIDPSVGSIAFVPICPHSLLSRPVIFSADAVLKAYPCDSSRDDVSLSIDGEIKDKLLKGEWVEIKRSKRETRIIRLKGDTFYDKLNMKFNLLYN